MHTFSCAACESEISVAVTETKQAQMRLKSAQSELKEKEAACKASDHSYTQDKAKVDALGKEISKLEVLYTPLIEYCTVVPVCLI